jgi:hypothetical protein
MLFKIPMWCKKYLNLIFLNPLTLPRPVEGKIIFNATFVVKVFQAENFKRELA